MNETQEKLYKAILLLDCAMPYFEQQAKKEARKPASPYGLREVTCQQRLETVRKFIADVGPTVGYVE